jgi:hypothetical protein
VAGGLQGPDASGRGKRVGAHPPSSQEQARKRPGFRKDPGLLHWVCRSDRPWITNLNRGPPWQASRRVSRPNMLETAPCRVGCRRSLTSCRETAPVTGRTVALAPSADVAQWVERDLAMVEATSSRLVIRSMSGVSVRKRGFAGVHVRGHAAGHVQRVAWCTGPLACGHSRHGLQCLVRLEAKDAGLSPRQHGFESRTRYHATRLSVVNVETAMSGSTLR